MGDPTNREDGGGEGGWCGRAGARTTHKFASEAHIGKMDQPLQALFSEVRCLGVRQYLLLTSIVRRHWIGRAQARGMSQGSQTGKELALGPAP